MEAVLNKDASPTDQQYLETLMRDSALVLPRQLRVLQEKRAVESVDELIEKKLIDPKDRQSYIDINMGFLNPATIFQGRVLRRLKSQALGYLSDEEAVLKAVPVGVLSTPEMNAFAIRTPRGGAAVALNSALWLYLKIAFYSFLAMIYRKTEYAIGAHHTNETYARNLYTLVSAMRTQSIIIMSADGEHSIADCVGDAARPEQMVLQNMQHALVFILLHEYGHIHHGHLDVHLTRRVSTEKENIDIYVTSQEQEFEADEFAVRRFFLEGEKQMLNNVSHIVAITMLFLLFDLCEDDSVSEILGTHPKSKKRLERIYATCEKQCGEGTWMKMQKATVYLETVFTILNNHITRYA